MATSEPTRPIAALVESNTTGTGRLFAKKLREEGFHPVLMTDRPERYAYAVTDQLETLVVDTQSDAAITEACRRVARGVPLAGVLTSSDYYVAAAARVASRFGLPAKDALAVERAQDKRMQRELCSRAGVLCPRFWNIESLAELDAAIDAVGLPAVVKPAMGSGSVNVRLCRSRAEARAQLETIFGSTHNERGQRICSAAVLEEWIDGREVSVEVFDGHALVVIDKHLGAAPHFLEIGHDVPSALARETTDVLRRAAERAVAVLGVSHGPCHVELRVAQGRAYLIEVNVRLAGGFLPELVRLATGIDLTLATVRAACGSAPDLQPSRARCAAIRFLVPDSSGVLTRVRGASDARGVPGVEEVEIYRGLGEAVMLRGDFRDRVGHVIAAHADRPACARSLALALGGIRIDTEEAA